MMIFPATLIKYYTENCQIQMLIDGLKVTKNVTPCTDESYFNFIPSLKSNISIKLITRQHLNNSCNKSINKFTLNMYNQIKYFPKVIKDMKV